jgi:hypothetical protein
MLKALQYSKGEKYLNTEMSWTGILRVTAAEQDQKELNR